MLLGELPDAPLPAITTGRDCRETVCCVAIDKRVRGCFKSLMKSWLYSLAGEVRRTDYLRASRKPSTSRFEGSKGTDLELFPIRTHAWQGTSDWEAGQGEVSTCSKALAGLWVWPSLVDTALGSVFFSTLGTGQVGGRQEAVRAEPKGSGSRVRNP